MMRSLKCCKNKEFTNFCCICCYAIYHPSCMDRCSEIVKLGGYKIFCSSDCQTKHNERLNKELIYEDRIRHLETELTDKDRYIKRLKRDSQTFEDVVYDAENKLTSQLESLSKRNASLQEEIELVRRKEANLVSEMESLKEVKQKLEDTIKDLTNINKNLISTVATLEQDNDVYSKELKEAKQTIFDLKHQIISDNSIKKGENTDTTEGRTSAKKKNQLLIMGDECIRGIALHFKNYTERTFDINCQIKPSTFFADFVSHCGLLARRLDKSDYVILFASDFNVVRGKEITSEELDQLLSITSHTNLIIIGCNFHVNRHVLNNFIDRQNSFFNSYLHGKQASFIPNFSAGYKRIMDYETKRQLTAFIVQNCILPDSATSKLTTSKLQNFLSPQGIEARS